ncbi:MAG: sensor histidine kinase [Candidatus Pristimantibacillus sp.]
MRLKIRTKIMASTILVIAVSLLISGYFTYNYVTSIIRDQSVSDSMTKLAQVSFQLKKVQEQTIKTAQYIISDEEIGSTIHYQPGNTLETDYFRKQNVQEKLKRFTALNAFITNVMIVRHDGEIYSNNSGYEDYFNDEYLQQPWFVERMSEKTGFSGPHPFFYLNYNRQVFSYIIKYRPLQEGDSSSSSDNYNFLVLDVNYSEIENAFQTSASDFEQLVLLGKNNEILYKNGQVAEEDEQFLMQTLENEQGNTFVEDKQRIVIVNNEMTEGWKQAAYISKERLFAKINAIFLYYFIIFISSLLFVFMLMLPIIHNIIKPVSRLTHAMKRISVGDLNTVVSIKSKDELEILGNGFNRMAEQLKDYMESSVQHEQTKRKMQVDLLMSQINPHFVYNTLNTVIYLSHAGRNKEAASITEALISILQDTIKTGDGAVMSTLHEEQQIIQQYGVIQQTRYPDTFRIEWRIPESLAEVIIPRMALQPLVENALFHGLCPSDQQDGIITITAEQAGQQLHIQVADNGVGMTESDLQQLLIEMDKPRDPNREGGIAMRNIKERIQFLYGDQYGLSIESVNNKGTTILIILPLQLEKTITKTAGYYTK